MLREGDEHWLRENYPGLAAEGAAVVGILDFTASYDREPNRFVILRPGADGRPSGEVLSGTFQVQIEPRKEESTSQLPAVHVEGLDPVDDRHFGGRDRSACLCSPLEEREFLEPEFDFRTFLERLIVPFLYGQVYYSTHGHWPWGEYAHGATGILEAYSKVDDSSRAEECIRQLENDLVAWPRIRSALNQKSYVRGHTPCFCRKMDKIKRCHPDALKGILRLQQHLKERGARLS